MKPVHVCVLALMLVVPQLAVGDGKVVPPRNYSGSLEEKAQEAIIIFHASDEPDGATEDLILKIQVAGEAASFAWIVPFPSKPTVKEESDKLFQECFRYVEARRSRGNDSKNEGSKDEAKPQAAAGKVKVLSREIVGKFDVAVVQEVESGTLNQWLSENGYQSLDKAEDVLEFYRKKQYVFACIKVDAAQLVKQRVVDLHPLRFSFKTGGQDGIYFPMKLTGLQSARFDVNLYVFYRYWLNDNLSKFGYAHRGFQLRHRDWDTDDCVANGGKAFTDPQNDPYLSGYGRYFPTVTKLLQKLHPGERYYLTNIQANRLNPKDIRDWSDDLWLFPYYTDPDFVPYDARKGGPASAAWPALQIGENGGGGIPSPFPSQLPGSMLVLSTVGVALIGLGAVVLFVSLRGRSNNNLHG